MFEGSSASSPLLDMSAISVFNDTAAGPAPKRIRLETGISAILNQLKSVKKPIDLWPWYVCICASFLYYKEKYCLICWVFNVCLDVICI